MRAFPSYSLGESSCNQMFAEISGMRLDTADQKDEG